MSEVLDKTACILQDLYDSEINYEISTFWDGGFAVKLGDVHNGFKCSATAERFENAVEWLRVRAIEQYPNSTFARTYAAKP